MSRPHQRRNLAFLAAACLLTCAAFACAAERPTSNPGEPADAKARITFITAGEFQQHQLYAEAIDRYRKANQQDGRRCTECLQRAYTLAMQIGSYKDAEDIGKEMLAQAGDVASQAAAHYRTALAAQNAGVETHKKDCFLRSSREFSRALQQMPQLYPAHFGLGINDAHLHQDAQARREFSLFLAKDRSSLILRQRAQRFLRNPGLARATMAPSFELATLDGKHLSLDSLSGKVVLIDFWATWCVPCIAALPQVRHIAREFAGQPLVVLSVSLDSDDAKWKTFLAKNDMTWPQYRDGVNGIVAHQFGVHAVPATFTIDADGVLQSQPAGDPAIEWKLKKLIAHAAQFANRDAADPAQEKSPAANR